MVVDVAVGVSTTSSNPSDDIAFPSSIPFISTATDGGKLLSVKVDGEALPGVDRACLLYTSVEHGAWDGCQDGVYHHKKSNEPPHK